MHPWTFYLLAVAQDRERETRQSQLARLARDARGAQIGGPDHTSRLRRRSALALAAMTRGTARAVRRLDDCVADDLQHALAPSE